MKYKLWIKAAALLTVLCMLSVTMLACGKARPVKGTEEELTPVGTVAGHEVLYEELRYLTLKYREAMKATYGETIWDTAESREQYRADLRLLHGVDADPEELLLIGLDLVQFHRAQRGDLAACRQLIPVVYKVDHREIQSLDLIQQGALLLLIQLIKVAKRMLLAIFCQLLQCLFIRKHCLFPPFFMFLLYCLITQRLRLPAARFFASSSKNFCCSTTSSLLSK